MNHHIKRTFDENSQATLDQQALSSAKDLGIEFMHFDTDDKLERRHVVPLGKFMNDTPLTSEEYLITRSLVAAQASK